MVPTDENSSTDTSSFSSSDHNAEATRRTPEDEPKARPELSAESDLLWLRCESFVESIELDEVHTVHPMHIALVLLFDSLDDANDPRLADITESQSTRDQRSLFWQAIDGVARSRLPDTLDAHIAANSKLRADTQPRAVPAFVGQAIWERVIALGEDDFHQSFAPAGIQMVSGTHATVCNRSDSVRQTVLDDCCDATRVVIVRAGEICEAKVWSGI